MTSSLRGRWIAAVALLGLAASAATAGGPTVDVGRRDVWKPGDVATTTIREDRTRELHVPDLEAAAGPSKPVRLKTNIVYVEKCLEASLDGDCTRALLWFSSWSQDNGATKDETLVGAFVEVSGSGKNRQFALKGTPTTPSKPALAWLSRHFGAGSLDPDDVRRAWLPKVAVGVGDEWGADLSPIIEGFADSKSIDRAKATSSARLTSTDGVTTRIECKASLPLTAFPAGKDSKPRPWTSGGTFATKGTLTIRLEGRIAASTLVTSGTLEGAFDVDGHATTLLSKIDRMTETKPGGEMPEAPSAPKPNESPPPPDPKAPGSDPVTLK
jgi:hypothetical protein